MNWKLTVGMEIHVELETKTKMFCGCPNDPFGTVPNTNVCPVCYGLPGTLPLLNKEAVAMVVRLGQAIKSEVATETFWARKNYFYPDLPKGYQISQSTHPLVVGGTITIDGTDYHLDHAHLEEDAGKLMHAPDKTHSVVNFNRAGVPLLEIVTKPDFHTAAAAKLFCQELQRIMRSLKISSADMEKGQMRCEANISVSQTDELGKKVEVKNINSFRSVEKAIEYEFDRQVRAIEAGETIREETRTWNDPESKTVAMRSKETSADYRYFPEPDLPWVAIKPQSFQYVSNPNNATGGKDYKVFPSDEIKLTDQYILPNDQRQWLIEQGLSPALAAVHVSKGNYETLREDDNYRKENNLLRPEHLSSAATIMDSDERIPSLSAEDRSYIYHSVAKGLGKFQLIDALNEAEKTNENIRVVIEGYLNSKFDLEAIVKEVLASNTDAATSYRGGKESVFQFLVGQVMAKTKGRANIQTVRTELEKALK